MFDAWDILLHKQFIEGEEGNPNDGCREFLSGKSEFVPAPEVLAQPELILELQRVYEAAHQLLFAGSYGSNKDIYSPTPDGWLKRIKPEQQITADVLSYDYATREVLRHVLVPMYQDISRGMRAVSKNESGMLILDGRQESHFRYSSAEENDGKVSGVFYEPDMTIRTILDGMRDTNIPMRMPMYLQFERTVQDEMPMYSARFSFAGKDKHVGLFSGWVSKAHKWNNTGLMNFVMVPEGEGFTKRMLDTFLWLTPGELSQEGALSAVFTKGEQFSYVTVKPDTNMVLEEIEIQRRKFDDASTNWLFDEAETLYAEQFPEGNEQELTFVKMGTTQIEGQKMAIWTQGDKPRSRQSSYDTATSGAQSLVLQQNGA